MLAGDSGIAVVGDAGTGAGAIGQAHALNPDVVLLDARLPDMPGDEVCRRLLASSPGYYPPTGGLVDTEACAHVEL